MLSSTDDTLITEVDPQAFFHDALREVIDRQQINTCHETTIYLSNLLTAFIRAEHLFEYTEEGLQLRPLAFLYADALEAPTIAERDNVLRRLGDIALFISGLFPGSLKRSLVDVDYYISMGGSAYGFLAESGRISSTSRAFRRIFQELSKRFVDFVDILAEVGDNTRLRQDSDLLRLYEIWLSSGSNHAASRLRNLGIQPVSVNRRTH